MNASPINSVNSSAWIAIVHGGSGVPTYSTVQFCVATSAGAGFSVRDETGRVQTEAVDVATQKLARHALARQRAAQRQDLLPGARPEGDAVSDGCRLQWPQRARFVPVGVRLGQPGLPHLLDQHAPAREHLHQPGDDRVQQRVQFVVCGRTGLDEHRHAIGTAPVHPVQHQAVQVDVEVGRRPKTLDQRDGAALALFARTGLAHIGLLWQNK